MARAKKDEDIHLVDLRVQNFRRLTFAHVKLDAGGQIVYVTGKNEAGKSSVLDSICALVEGKRSVPDGAIHDEAETGEKSLIRGKFSNGFTVERRFSERNPKGYLTVLSADGGEYKQGKLDEWVAGISADAMHIWGLSKDRLLETLLKLTDAPDALQVLEGMDEDMEALKKSRTPHNSTKQRFERTPEPEGKRPEPIDTAAESERLANLLAQQEAFKEAGQAQADKHARFMAVTDSVTTAAELVSDLQARLAEAEKKLADAQAEWTRADTEARAAQEAYAALEDPQPDIEEVQAMLARASQVQAQLAPWLEYDRLEADAGIAEKEVERLNQKIEKKQAEKAKYVAGIGSKIPDLTFREDLTPLLHGRELHAASGAQRARFGVDVMFAFNPKLKIVLVHEGASLDGDYLLQMEKDARKKNFQIWLCTIQEGHAGEIKVVEGRVEDDRD